MKAGICHRRDFLLHTTFSLKLLGKLDNFLLEKGYIPHLLGKSTMRIVLHNFARKKNWPPAYLENLICEGITRTKKGHDTVSPSQEFYVSCGRDLIVYTRDGPPEGVVRSELDDALEILQRMDMDEDMVSETVTPINVKFPWWLVRKKGLRQVQRWYLSRLSKMGKEPSDYVFFHSKKSQRKNPGTRGIQRVLDSWSNTVEKKGNSLSKGVRLKKKARYPWASFVVDLSAEENNLNDILRMRSGDMTAHQSSNNYPLLRLRGGGNTARPSSNASRPPHPTRPTLPAQISAEK